MEAIDGKGFCNKTKPIKDHHRTLEDRLLAANRFVKETGFHAGDVVIDSMKDEMCYSYDAHPERLLVIQDGRVVHDGGNGGGAFGLGLIRYDCKGNKKTLLPLLLLPLHLLPLPSRFLPLHSFLPSFILGISQWLSERDFRTAEEKQQIERCHCQK